MPTLPHRIVNATILPLLFLSGVFIPIGDDPPGWVSWAARIFPVNQFVDGIQAGFLGTPFHWNDVLIVAIWGVAGHCCRPGTSRGGHAPDARRDILEYADCV